MTPETFYHIYNRGNNRQPIFLLRDNYVYFLRKVRKHLFPHVKIVAYCLMPNHFHFLVNTNSDIDESKFSNDLRVMLSSYTRAINKQENRIGSLFQQNTKIKNLEESRATTPSGGTTSYQDDNQPFICFHYIHQNPLKAGLVRKMEDWEMSSYRDYAGIRNGTFCDRKLANKLLDVPVDPEKFIDQSVRVKIFDEIG